jgi:hypothetical protein
MANHSQTIKRWQSLTDRAITIPGDGGIGPPLWGVRMTVLQRTDADASDRSILRFELDIDRIIKKLTTGLAFRL